MLAFSSREVRDSVLAGDLPSMSESMLSNAQEIRHRLESVWKTMYDSTAGESPSGIYSIAAPVLDESGSFVASIGVIGTNAQIGVPPDQEKVALVQRCAATISKSLQSNEYERVGVVGWDPADLRP